MRPVQHGHVPEEVLAELKRLKDLSSQATGATALGDPKREAGDKFCALASQAISEYGVSAGQLSLALGLSYDNVRLTLSRRGYGKPFPSQKNYKGEVSVSKKKDFCRRGHAMTGGNVGSAGANARRCLACARESDRARYAAKKAARG